MATNTPGNLKYTSSHEWISGDDQEITVGITDFAQSQLGEIVFIELPQEDDSVSAGQECAVIESVKAASDIYAPVSGTISEVNTVLEDATEQINDDPYGKGWLFKIKPATPDELQQLLSAEEYIKETNQ